MTSLQKLASKYSLKNLKILLCCPTVIQKDISDLWNIPSNYNIENEYYKKELKNKLSPEAKEIMVIAATLEGNKIKTKLTKKLLKEGYNKITIHKIMKELLNYYQCLRLC